MIVVDETSLMKELKKAMEWAAGNKENGFVSHIMAIKPIDSLAVFLNSTQLAERHRVFWSDNEGLTLVGIGAALEWMENGTGRFKKAKDMWKNLSQKAVKNRDIKGTGPLMLGGFSFSENAVKGKEWTHFPDSAFIIPRYLFTESDGQSWLTINIEVTSDFDPLKTYEAIKEDLTQLTDISAAKNQASVKIYELIPEGKEEWLQAVSGLIQRIQSGEVEKVVLSRVLNAQLNQPLQPALLLEKLLQKRSYGFVFAIERDGDCFLGATPERLIKRDGNIVLCDCLAGTEGRGKTPDEDEAIGRELLQDEKNLAEHQFVVEMIKNVMAGFANDVVSAERPGLVKAESVQHLYTPVSGWMKDNTTIFDAINQLHPTPAMGGTPREKALSIISELEPQDRGWYAAPVGWVDEDGNGDFAVGIRSGLVHGSQVRLFAGCGIVKDSIPEKEYRETEMKFRPILNALEEVSNE